MKSFTVRWEGRVEGRNERKALRVVEAVQEELGATGLPAKLKEAGAGEWRFEFAMPVAAEGDIDATYRVLVLASRLSDHWTVRTWLQDDGMLRDFAGMCKGELQLKHLVSVGFDMGEPFMTDEGILLRTDIPPPRRLRNR